MNNSYLLADLLKSSSSLICAIINVTPDSFSGDGLIASSGLSSHAMADSILLKIKKALKDGAHIIDIGAESTRPGHSSISADEEIERLYPVFKLLKKEYAENLPFVLSIDTQKAAVAEVALAYGATLINDVSGIADPEMPLLLKTCQPYVVVMHPDISALRSPQEAHKVCSAPIIGEHYISQSPPFFVFDGEESSRKSACLDLCSNEWSSVYAYLEQKTQRLQELGVEASRILIDIGIGFGKTPSENIALLQNLDKFKDLGYPIFLGVSRKSFIGAVTQSSVHERLGGSIASLVLGITKGVKVFRVHDVFESCQAARLVDLLSCKNL